MTAHQVINGLLRCVITPTKVFSRMYGTPTCATPHDLKNAGLAPIDIFHSTPCEKNPKPITQHGLTLPTFSLILCLASMIGIVAYASGYLGSLKAEPVTRLSLPARECPKPTEGQVLMVIFAPVPEQPGRYTALCQTAKARG